MATPPSEPPRAFNEGLFKGYEDGKHRRYNLLFAVNGGAFAVAKLLGERGTAGVGNLTTSHLAVGMIIFTAIMGFDIFMFGRKMRKQSMPDSQPDSQKTSLWTGLFGWEGRFVVVAISILISVGWWSVCGGKAEGRQTGGDLMQAEIRDLALLNHEIGAAENAGDLERLGGMVAPSLAFRRRDGAIVDRDAFLQTPRPGNRQTRIESIHVYGNRAVVTCVVTDSGVVTHNIRLFAKQEGNWRLLGWANEPT